MGCRLIGVVQRCTKLQALTIRWDNIYFDSWTGSIPDSVTYLRLGAHMPGSIDYLERLRNLKVLDIHDKSNDHQPVGQVILY